tara:strand:+ start:761 stop:1498 length:738 start_codon:yes stop_codon:yes gene_type:complete
MAPYKQPYGFKGGPGGGIFPTPKEDEPKKKQGAESQIIDPYKGKDSKVTQEFVNPDFDTNVDYSSLSGESVIEDAIQRGRQKFKSKNRGRKRLRGSVGGSIDYSTPWKRYRAAIKDFKQKEIKEKTDPFSKERRLAKQDLRGKFDSTGRRLSFKNQMQQRYLVGRRRGRDGNTQRGFHNPHIPEFKNRVSFAEWRQNRRNEKEKAAGGVKIGGCTPSGGKFTGEYRASKRDFFGHGSQCGPKGGI